MILPCPYDLLVILAGDKPARHPVARELVGRGWARYLTVTGEHEWIDPTPELQGRILAAPPSGSTYQDARSIHALVHQHDFTTILVVTSATQAERARLTLAKALAGLPVTVHVLTIAPIHSGNPSSQSVARLLLQQLSEQAKLAYYHARRRA